MSDSGGYQVRTDELAKHAKAVEQVAAELGQALSAAEQVTMGVQAYGLICGPLFVPMVLAVSAPGLVTLGLSREAVTSISDAITKTVRSYQNAEQSHSSTLKSLGKELA
ncbi:MAG TPA: type VII secretion target [Amycolatopsis sp.]|uniref:type VII secretion target n=1 Tax=Amycolatopsis sp. TaxID=37632 RepID=UPI002B45EAA6|nr:type VII secretion target [Amycolatopsis sp.]HKS47837.1 type VII secretion target [Amycolatopsis sp.]